MAGIVNYNHYNHVGEGKSVVGGECWDRLIITHMIIVVWSKFILDAYLESSMVLFFVGNITINTSVKSCLILLKIPDLLTFSK